MEKPTLEQTLKVIKTWKFLKDSATYCAFNEETAKLILEYWDRI